MIQFGAKFFLKLIFLMSTTKQLSLIQRLYHKKTTTNNCLGEVKCSVNIRQRWSLLSVSHLKLAIDLIPPRSGLHIKPMLWYCSSETDELCVCVSVCRAHSCSPGSGHYQKKNVFRLVFCPLIVIQTVISLRSLAQRLPTHIRLHF